MRNAVIAAIVVFAATTSAAGTPAQAIADGRARSAARDCHGAVAVMQDAVPAAVTLADPKESSEALAAIHFYSAGVQSRIVKTEVAKKKKDARN